MNNGLISRDTLFKTWDALDETQDPNLLVDAMIKAAQEAPAVDAEPVRHGWWGRFGKTHYRIVCSDCKFPTPFKKQANGYHLAWKSNYCPNCGAKMEQEDN